MCSSNAPSIVWFRKDLRLDDNPAFTDAVTKGPVIPLFLWSPNEEDFSTGGASRVWLYHSLLSLKKQLAVLGLNLIIRKGNSVDNLFDIVDYTNAKAVYTNKRYEPSSLKKDKEIANKLISKNNPSDYNQAIMDFGSTICKPVSPLCISCLYNDSCYARLNKKVNQFPVKKSISKLRIRYLNFFVFIFDEKKVLIEKRTNKDIWKNLYQFPLVETNCPVNNKEQLSEKISSEKMDELNLEKFNLWNSNPIIHKLSHQKLHIFFWIITSKIYLKKGYSLKALKKRAVPVVIQNFIDNFFKVDD